MSDDREASRQARYGRRHELLGRVMLDGQTPNHVADLLALLVRAADVSEGFQPQDEIPTVPRLPRGPKRRP